MTYNFKPKRERCPYCGKKVALNRKGRLQTHNFGSTGNKCHPPSKNKGINNGINRSRYSTR